MLFLFEPPVKSRNLNYKQVVNLTLPSTGRENKNENNEESLDPYGSTDRHIIALRDQRIGLHHGLCGL